ncbi:hypothetical protein [Allosphingosinicella humi]|jgi:hypothetical protein
MTRETATVHPAQAFARDEGVRPNRPYNVGIAVRTPTAIAAVLADATARPHRAANDDTPSLAFLVPISLLTLFMLWVVISPL